MERIKVDSSNIVAVGYDEEKETLEVEFKGSGVYQFTEVYPAIYTAFMAAESKGKFFAGAIRSKFPSVKLPPEEKKCAECGNAIKSEGEPVPTITGAKKIEGEDMPAYLFPDGQILCHSCVYLNIP